MTEGCCHCLRRLRSGNSLGAAVDPEKGDALDSLLPRPRFLGAYLLPPLPALQEIRSVEPGRAGDLRQNLAVADVAAVQKIDPKQRLDHGILRALLTSQPNEPMRVEGVGRALHAVEGEVNSLSRAGLAYLRIESLRALPAAEFACAIQFPVYPFGGHIRIQLERAPVHFGLSSRLQQNQRLLETALADETPGAYHVGDNVDCQLHSHSRCPVYPGIIGLNRQR